MGSPAERHLPSAAPKPLEWVALLAASAYLISPVLFLAWRHAGAGSVDLLFAFNLVTSLLWLTLLHLLVRRPFLLHLLLLPLYITTAIDLFLVGTFGARLSTGYVTIALTDYGESGELFLTYTRAIVLAAVLLLLVYLPCLFGMRKLRKQRSAPWAAVVAGALVGVYALALVRDISVDGQSARAAVFDVAAKELSSPVGALFQGGLALQMHVKSEAFRKQRAAHSFGATMAAGKGSEIYVWVVGESSRPQNWSLFGYPRDTTPRLRATPGVVGLPDMLTTAPHTSVAVPSMLSLRPITNWPAILAERSIVEAFNEVGFKTYWLSAQAADGWTGLVPQIATEAKWVRYFTSGNDGAMLDEFHRILDDAKPGDRLFVVLHTKGSHFEYSRRYPPEFARFSGGETRRERLLDEYDNSILYTDWFVAQTIASLEQRKGRSALIYASDHGENLLDDDRQLLGHALGTAYDLPTAALAWVSDELARSQPQQMHALRENATAKLSLSNLPHSLLDLAGIETRELDLRLSVFSDRFKPTPRSYIVRGELRSERDASIVKASSQTGQSRTR